MFAEYAYRELMQAYGRAAEADEMESVSRRLAIMTEEQTVLLTRQWRQDHPDKVPDFQDLLSIQRRSSMSADELLTAQYREELLMVVGKKPEAEQEEPTPPDTRPLSQRWVEDLEFVTGSDESLTLADRLWRSKTPHWVVLAASLIEVWVIEGRRLPQTVTDAAAKEIEKLVAARVLAEGARRKAHDPLTTGLWHRGRRPVWGRAVKCQWRRRRRGVGRRRRSGSLSCWRASSTTVTIRTVAYSNGQRDQRMPGRPRDSAREAEILRVVLGLMSEVGVAGISFEEVARRASASKRTLYRRWATKEQMVVAAIKAGPASASRPDPIDTGSLRGDLLALLERLEATLEAGASVSLTILEAGLRDPELCEHIEKTTGPTGARLPETVLQSAIERGELPDNADPFAYEEVAAAVLIIRKLNGLSTDATYRQTLVDSVLIPALRDAVTVAQSGIFSGRPTPASPPSIPRTKRKQ